MTADTAMQEAQNRMETMVTVLQTDLDQLEDLEDSKRDNLNAACNVALRYMELAELEKIRRPLYDEYAVRLKPAHAAVELVQHA